MSVFSELRLAFDLLGDRRVLRVLLWSLALTLAIFVAAWFALDAAIGRVPAEAVPGFLHGVWSTARDWAALPIVLAAAWFLFPAIATGVMGIFLDDVVDAVEARHFPGSAARRRVGIGESAWLGLGSLARMLFWNLLLLPLYTVLLFTAVGPVALFVALNGWLMGRDFLEMVAIRHMDRRKTRAYLASHRRERLVVGALAAGLFLVPVLNLLAPILSAALATFVFHRTDETPALAA